MGGSIASIANPVAKSVPAKAQTIIRVSEEWEIGNNPSGNMIGLRVNQSRKSRSIAPVHRLQDRWGVDPPSTHSGAVWSRIAQNLSEPEPGRDAGAGHYGECCCFRPDSDKSDRPGRSRSSGESGYGGKDHFHRIQVARSV
ncbi:hypothetical protein [Streptomyces sp. NPDC002640]